MDMPGDCAHARAIQAQSATTSLANSLKNYGQHGWMLS